MAEESGLSMMEMLRESARAPVGTEPSSSRSRTAGAKAISIDADRKGRSKKESRAIPRNSAKAQQDGALLAEKQFADLLDRTKRKPVVYENDSDLTFCTLADIIAVVTSSAATPMTDVTLYLTYTTFTTGVDIVNELASRFTSCENELDSDAIRQNCVRFVATWIQEYWRSFVNESAAVTTRLIEWRDQIQLQPKFVAKAESLSRTIAQIATFHDSPPSVRKVARAEFPPIPVLSVFPGEDFSILQVHPCELARQITILDEEVFAAIGSEELLGERWTKEKTKDLLAPNIIKATNRFNQMNNWVKAEILVEEKVPTRAAKLLHLLRTARYLLDINNFNGALNLIAALGSSAVHRLSKTFALIPDTYIQELANLRQELSNDSNWKSVRGLIARRHAPAIPYLGMYLTDLLFLGESRSQVSDTQATLIPFGKLKKYGKIISRIRKYQSVSYNFARFPPIINHIMQFQLFDDDEAYQLSKYIEPRGGGEPTVEKLEGICESSIPHGYRLPPFPSSESGHTRSSSSSSSRTRSKKKERIGKKFATVSAKTISISAPFHFESDETDETESVAPTVQDTSFNEIIEEVTPPVFDPEKAETMLLTYRSICTALDLLTELFNRFNSSWDESGDSIRDTVLAFLKLWVKEYHSDFLQNRRTLIPAVMQFHQKVQDSGYSDSIKSGVKEVVDLITKYSQPPAPEFVESPSPMQLTLPLSSILDIPPLELARQLTIFAEQEYDELSSWEFLDKSWVGPTASREAPILTPLLTYYKELQGICVTTILTAESSSVRKSLLKYWISVGQHSHELKNFFSGGAIFTALMSPPLVRCKKLWSSLKKKGLQDFQLTSLIYSSDDFSRIRARMKEVELPYLPFLQPYLEALSKIDGQHSSETITLTELINYEKRRESSSVLKELFRFQSTNTFPFMPLREVRSFIRTISFLSEDTLLTISEFLEPLNKQQKGQNKPRALLTKQQAIAQGIFHSDEEWVSTFPVMIEPGRGVEEDGDGEGNGGGSIFGVADDPTTIEIAYEAGHEVVAAGVVDKLLERMCVAPPSQISVEVLLSCYREFCEPVALLKKLSRRFSLPPLTSNDKKLWILYQKQVTVPLQERIINILMRWVNSHSYDFLDTSLFTQFQHFVEGTLELINRSAAHTLINNLKLEIAERKELLKGDISRPSTGVDANFLNFEPVQIAQQFCLWQWKLFKLIPAQQFIDMGYLDKSRKEAVEAYCSSALSIAAVVQQDIKAAKDRKKVLTLWLLVLQHLRSLKNWNGYYGVSSGLAPYFGTEHLPQTTEAMDEAYKLFFNRKHTRRMKAFHASSLQVPPALPYFKVLEEEFSYIVTQQYPDVYARVTNWSVRMVDVPRCNKLHSILEDDVYPLQSTPYDFPKISNLYDFIVRLCATVVPLPPFTPSDEKSEKAFPPASGGLQSEVRSSTHRKSNPPVRIAVPRVSLTDEDDSLSTHSSSPGTPKQTDSTLFSPRTPTRRQIIMGNLRATAPLLPPSDGPTTLGRTASMSAAHSARPFPPGHFGSRRHNSAKRMTASSAPTASPPSIKKRPPAVHTPPAKLPLSFSPTTLSFLPLTPPQSTSVSRPITPRSNSGGSTPSHPSPPLISSTPSTTRPVLFTRPPAPRTPPPSGLPRLPTLPSLSASTPNFRTLNPPGSLPRPPPPSSRPGGD